MHCYLLDPKAPLVFRTGRPFGETGGAETLPFPLPSTLAGALRTAWAENQASAFDYTTRATELLRQIVAGPLLVRRALAGGMPEVLFPRPADVLYLNADQSSDGPTVRAYRLSPGEVTGDGGCDLPAGLQSVFLDAAATKGKPARGALVFWTEATMRNWLFGQALSENIEAHGAPALPIDNRNHVAIDPATFGADSGRLFQSGGLDFGPRRLDRQQRDERGWENREYALLARSSAEIPKTLRRLGGEGRCAWIEPCTAWPSIPEGLSGRIATAGRLRLILATPAIFAGGWRPGWLDEHTLEGSPPGLDDLHLKLCACALDRWQAVSGWDLAAKKPRAVRRMVPTGAVYWFEIQEGTPEDIAELWLRPLSDHEQDRRDGFGLALPGVWRD